MKKYTYTIIILCCIAQLSAQGENDPQKISTINLYYVCSQTNTNNAPQIVSALPELKTSCRTSLLQHLRSLSWQHKGKVIAGSILSSYTGIVGKLILTVHTQYKQPAWACWKQEVPLDVLTQMAQETVIEELIATICQREDGTTKHIPQLSMLYKTLQEINQELHTLQKSTNLYRFVEYTALTKIVPYDSTDHVDALEKINRLTYLKNLLENLTIVPPTHAGAA